MRLMLVLALVALGGCASAAPQVLPRSSIVTAQLTELYAENKSVRTTKDLIDDVVNARLKIACDKKVLDEGTCDLIVVQVNLGKKVHVLNVAGVRLIRAAIANPDAPVAAGGIDVGEILSTLVEGYAASQTGGLSNILLKK